jgi:hydrogenase nickel incorporation protein HypB
MKLKVVSKILDANEKIAQENRKVFDQNRVFVVNLMSSPGAGKTTLLEQTIRSLRDGVRIAVIEGDITGTDDAQRIDALGVPVVQINTEGGCHLDASMVQEALNDLPIGDIELLFVENVGNLVCPAEFYIGEDIKAMVLSITEGHDKPLKYPMMFRQSRAAVINKIDLKDYLDVDIEKIKRDIYTLNPTISLFETSCKTGQGIAAWTEWIETHCLCRRP